MTITYLFHSGFVVETDTCTLVFDYWLDPTQSIQRFLQSEKPMFVFASHFHEDHFTQEIFKWKAIKSNITYILSKDILKRRRAQKEEADVWLAKGGKWENELIKVWATGSTDSGVSWIVEADHKRIFHAGDLNNWYAHFLTEEYKNQLVHSDEFNIDVDPVKEDKRFLGELKDIHKIADRFDLVFFPIDGRIGNGYTRGGRQFIQMFQVGMFVPMHFVASGFESAHRMQEFTDPKDIPFWKIQQEGETLSIE